MTQERRRRRKDAIINNFIFQSAYLSRMNKKELLRKMEPGLKSSQIALRFFLYHEMLPIIMKRVNWILFFHLSNNWFDISEHFKGSLARRLCSKLQYKAEDLPLAECQVYARLSLPHPIYLPPPSHPLSPLSLSLYLLSPNPLKYESNFIQLVFTGLFVCVCAPVSRSARLL